MGASSEKQDKWRYLLWQCARLLLLEFSDTYGFFQVGISQHRCSVWGLSPSHGASDRVCASWGRCWTG
jgi:hypothetical protein